MKFYAVLEPGPDTDPIDVRIASIEAPNLDEAIDLAWDKYEDRGFEVTVVRDHAEALRIAEDYMRNSLFDL